MAVTDILFQIINWSVVPAWALLIVAPNWTWTRRVVHAAYIPLAFGIFYGACLAAAVFFGQRAEGASFFSVAGISAAFSHPVGVLVGWSHYLVFDLFIGSWIARDAGRCGASRALVIPALIVTLWAGPLGLLVYLAGRSATGKAGFSLDEAPAA